MEPLPQLFSCNSYMIDALWKVVTSVTPLSYNREIDFSLNLIKPESIMAGHISYFALFVILFSLQSLLAFSQQRGGIRLNLITSTFPVQPVQTHNFFLLRSAAPHPVFESAFNFQTDNTNAGDECGTGTSGNGDVATNPNGNPNVSPDSKVLNPGLAVDGDLSTYSELNIMVKQKDVEVVQFVTFSATIKASDVVKLTFSLREVLHNTSVKLQAYNGASLAGQPMEIGGTLPLLPAAPVEYNLAPGVIFDRVRIGVTALDNGNDKALVNLHEISLKPPAATPSTSGGGSTSGGSSTVLQCEGNVILSVNNASSGYVYKWYNASNVLLQESTNTTFMPAGLTASGSPYTYYLSSSRSTGCTIESPKHQISLTVKAKPLTPGILLTN